MHLLSSVLNWKFSFCFVHCVLWDPDVSNHWFTIKFLHISAFDEQLTHYLCCCLHNKILSRYCFLFVSRLSQPVTRVPGNMLTFLLSLGLCQYLNVLPLAPPWLPLNFHCKKKIESCAQFPPFIIRVLYPCPYLCYCSDLNVCFLSRWSECWDVVQLEK